MPAYVDERLEIFPTRLLRRRLTGLDAVNDRLARRALAWEAADEGIVRSNVGGWHSRDNFLEGDDPEVVVLRELFVRAVQEWVAWGAGTDPSTTELAVTLQGWAIVARRGHYARPHVHPSSHVALVYYVDAGDPPGEGPLERQSGRFELLDPRNRPEMLELPGVPTVDSLSMAPVTGMLLAFPAWLYHFVHPYQGERPRVCVAANAYVRRPLGGP